MIAMSMFMSIKKLKTMNDQNHMTTRNQGTPEARPTSDSDAWMYHSKSPIKTVNAVFMLLSRVLNATISPPNRMWPITAYPVKTAPATTQKWKISGPALPSVLVTSCNFGFAWKALKNFIITTNTFAAMRMWSQKKLLITLASSLRMASKASVPMSMAWGVRPNPSPCSKCWMESASTARKHITHTQAWTMPTTMFIQSTAFQNPMRPVV
mmetsp:Transcript_3243/g.8689  ORF Transcript_3243/g.8689 Transcript_3243/m.8689 type:complete len:210 (+) Transcript_3243:864-1493(+)